MGGGCKKANLSSTQGALCTVSVFFILHFTYLEGGAYATNSVKALKAQDPTLKIWQKSVQ